MWHFVRSHTIAHLIVRQACLSFLLLTPQRFAIVEIYFQRYPRAHIEPRWQRRKHVVFTRGGTLTGTGTVTVSGQVTWTGGTMSGTGATVANGGLAITAPAIGTVLLENRTLSNAGAATLSGAFFLEVGYNAIINNLSGMPVDLVSVPWLLKLALPALHFRRSALKRR